MIISVLSPQTQSGPSNLHFYSVYEPWLSSFSRLVFSVVNFLSQSPQMPAFFHFTWTLQRNFLSIVFMLKIYHRTPLIRKFWDDVELLRSSTHFPLEYGGWIRSHCPRKKPFSDPSPIKKWFCHKKASNLMKLLWWYKRYDESFQMQFFTLCQRRSGSQASWSTEITTWSIFQLKTLTQKEVT